MPVRTRRRVRDPYPIDSDDDEDLDELPETPKAKPPAQEESLIDFLNSVPPPPSNDQPPQPFVLTETARARTSGGRPPPPSALRTRAKRSASNIDDPETRAQLASGSVRFAPEPMSTKASLMTGANNRTGDSGSLPRVSRDRGQARITKPRSPTSGSGVTRTQRQTETGALADFLRNTGPPEPPTERPSTAMSDDRNITPFSRLFTRRKKVEA
jgi:hypothetical protein